MKKNSLIYVLLPWSPECEFDLLEFVLELFFRKSSLVLQFLQIYCKESGHMAQKFCCLLTYLGKLGGFTNFVLKLLQVKGANVVFKY